MSEVRLGQIIRGDHYRDAIHIAVAPVVAECILMPGQHVGIIDKEAMTVGPCSDNIGIVDPFLVNPVQKGERFYLCLYPYTITSLRHEWTHPAFPAELSKQVAMAWMEHFAKSLGESVEQVLWAADDYLANNELWVQGGRFEGMCVPDEFWDHYEMIREKKVPPDKRGSFFSCSC